MQEIIDAIYENGQLRLLSPVALTDGQRVQVAIQNVLSPEDVTDVVADLLVESPPYDGNSELDAMLEDIGNQLSYGKPLSEIILEERGDEL